MINWTSIVTFPFNVWKQTTPVELRNRKIGEIVVGASHWQLCIVLLDSGIMGMIGKLLLELEYCPRNNRANAKAKPLRTFFTGLMLRISKSFKSKILSLSSIYFKQLNCTNAQDKPFPDLIKFSNFKTRFQTNFQEIEVMGISQKSAHFLFYYLLRFCE